jgi:hypothetical protein
MDIIAVKKPLNQLVEVVMNIYSCEIFFLIEILMPWTELYLVLPVGAPRLILKKPSRQY